jgi:hypothetical protein
MTMKTIATVSGFLMASALLSNVFLADKAAAAQAASNLRCDGCVNLNDIANNAVTSAKIGTNAVTPPKLAPTAKPAGGDFSNPVNVSLTGIETVITSVTLTLPGPGIVIVNSGGYASFSENPSSAKCAITKGTVIGSEPIIYAQNHNLANARRMPIASTRGFQESTGGNKIYNLVCYADAGVTSLWSVMLTAVFAPQRY